MNGKDKSSIKALLSNACSLFDTYDEFARKISSQVLEFKTQTQSLLNTINDTIQTNQSIQTETLVTLSTSTNTDQASTTSTSINTEHPSMNNVSTITDAPSTNNASTTTEAKSIQNETFRDDDDEVIRLYLTSLSEDMEKASTALPNALNTVIDSICALPLHAIVDKNDSIIDTMETDESPEELNESTTANNTEMYITAINATSLSTTPKPQLISNSDTINVNNNSISANDTINDAETAIDDDLNDSNKENINQNENAKSSFDTIESNSDDRLIIFDTQINNTEETVDNEVNLNFNNNDNEMSQNLLVIDESRTIEDGQINGEKRSEKDDDEVSVPETVNSCSTNGGGTRRSTRQRAGVVKQEPTTVDMGRRRTRTAVKLEKIHEMQQKSIDELMSSMRPCLVRLRKLSSDEISEYVNSFKAQNSVKSEPEEKDIDYEKMLASIDDINNEKIVNKSKKNLVSKPLRKKKAKNNDMDDDELITDDEDDGVSDRDEAVLNDERIITADVVLNSESDGEYMDEDDENLISKERRKKILKATQKNENNGSCIDDDDDDDDFMKEFRMPHLEKEKANNSDNDEEVIKKASKKPKKRQRIDSASTDSSIASSSKRKTSQTKSDAESDDDTKGSDSDSQLPSISLMKKKSKSALDDSDEDEDWGKIKREKKCNSDEEDDDGNSNSQRKDGRRNIRRMIDDRKLTEETKAALEEERERQERLRAQRQLKEAIIVPLSSDSDSDVLNGTLIGSAAGDKSFEALESPFKEARKPLYLDVDTKSKRALIEVHKSIVKHLKPHQVDGIKFMYESCYESVEAVASGKAASGCILAHCMGLGKTLQVVALVHTLMTNPELTKTKRVLIFSPVNTLFNWKKEFDTWLAGTERIYGIYGVSNSSEKFTRADRKIALAAWFERGGVFLIGYNMFKIMLGVNKKNGNKVDEDMEKYLLNPGADLVVCDEGHYLKNASSKISNTINRIATKRRIVLTGTPLQNNLVEYHCMVSFVKPKLLGTLKEFRNRFANPIENGQHLDSTTTDVAIMKKRAHVLHNLLDGCVQRKDYNVIKPLLPPKTEYVVYLKISDVQKALISSYLKRTGTESIIRTNQIKGTRLFADFNFMMLVLAHPSLLHRKAEKDAKAKRDKQAKYDDKAEIENVAVVGAGKSDENNGAGAKGEQDDVESNSNDNVDDVVLPELNERWWKDIIGECVDEQQVKLRVDMSAKLIIFEQILAKCMQVGDKMLVFSQSLLTLDLIELYLDELHKRDKKQKWVCNQDYCRIDGEIDAKKRMRVIESFNKQSNKRLRLFLLSSRSGGIGINLVAANRIVIFDPTWNPSHDCQSVFRTYRFGQKKSVFIYRLLALGTMEEKIYQRQVNKLSISQRVVDEHQLDRHYKYSDLRDLYKFEPWDDSKIKEIPNVPTDTVLADLLRSHGEWIVKYHEHDSLLENKLDEGLTDEEKKLAWEDYENERNPKRNLMVNENPLISDAPMDMMGMGYQQNLDQLNRLAAHIQLNQNYAAANGGVVGAGGLASGLASGFASGSNVRPMMMQQNNRGAQFYASTPRTTLNSVNLPSFNPTPRLAGAGVATSAHANNMPNFNQYSGSSSNNQFGANQQAPQNVLRFVGNPNMQAPQDVLRSALLQRPQFNNNNNSNNNSNGANYANENNFNNNHNK